MLGMGDLGEKEGWDAPKKALTAALRSPLEASRKNLAVVSFTPSVCRLNVSIFLSMAAGLVPEKAPTPRLEVWRSGRSPGGGG